MQGARRSLADNARTTLLGAQDRERLEQAAEEPSLQGQTRPAGIWMAETKTDAVTAFDAFAETYGVKYEKAVECLTKDRGALLAFYDFTAEHWKHLRTTNPIARSARRAASRARHGLQARRWRAEELATLRRPQPVAKGNPRCEIHRRHRGHRQHRRASSPSRRLIH